MNKENQFSDAVRSSVVNINGIISNAEDAKISIFDRGFLYGDSIYEVTYTEDRSVIFLNDHMDRLFHSAKLLEMNVFYTRDEIIQEVMKTLSYGKISEAYIRIILTRGETAINLDPSASFKNNLVIIVKPKMIHPEDNYISGINLHIPNILRNSTKSVDPNAKSGNYLNNVMALAEAKKHGADDALMVNHNGEITEGTTFNIWFVINSILYTPDLKSGLLRGITREKVINICREQQIRLKVQTISRSELGSIDEAFITSSTRGIMPIRKIDEFIFGKDSSDWPIYQKISKFYQDAIQTEQQKQEYKYQ